MRAAAVALLCAGLGLACGAAPLYETPDERSGGVPLAQTPHPRTGELTWRAEQLETRPDGGVLLEFTLVNGTKRDYISILLRVVLRGGEHHLATARYPAGGLPAGSSRRIRAYLDPPGFAVASADLELLYAQE